MTSCHRTCAGSRSEGEQRYGLENRGLQDSLNPRALIIDVLAFVPSSQIDSLRYDTRYYVGLRLSEMDCLTDEDRGALAAAEQVVRQLLDALRQLPADITHAPRAGLAPSQRC